MTTANAGVARRTVLVVGASSGIGRATAQELVRRGHRVFGTSRDECRVTTPGVVPLSLEVLDAASIERAVNEVVLAAGRIDAVVYSAGFYVAGSVEEAPDTLARSQLEAYFLGAHRVARAVLPIMRAQRSGKLLFMSSSAAVAAIPFHAFYSASKAALEHYAEALRYEVTPFGIEVGCVQGTGVRTGTPLELAVSHFAPYEPMRSQAIRRFRALQLEGPEPAGFARCIAGAVEGRRLRAHYRVGWMAKLLPWLRAVLPRRIFERTFARHFDAPGTTSAGAG